MAAFLNGACQAAVFSDEFLGTWHPIAFTAVEAVLGPTHVQSMTFAKDTATGDYWMSYIGGQVFRVRQDSMQYCFHKFATSPFSVDTADDNLIRFCYKKGDRMHTHKAFENGTLATGCDAAEIKLELQQNGTLEFTFSMSPPVRHAWGMYKRVGPPPSIKSYTSQAGACDPLNPGAPTLSDELNVSSCPVINHNRQTLESAKPTADMSTAVSDMVGTDVDVEWPNPFGPKVECRKYDRMANLLDKVDIQLQYTVPKFRCWPCKVSYSVSAKIAEDEYIALGFKGMAYRALKWKGVQRPNYFGMSTDKVDDDRTTGAIVLGYAGSVGNCVREMKAESYSGAPSDVKGNPQLTNDSVERKNGRTIVRFTIEQHVGKNIMDINSFFNAEQFSARTMWAIGGLEGSGCEADVQFHRARGVSPLSWFGVNGKQKCLADAEELGVSLEDEVSVPSEQDDDVEDSCIPDNTCVCAGCGLCCSGGEPTVQCTDWGTGGVRCGNVTEDVAVLV